MFRLVLRLGVVLCVGMVVALVAARLLGERRERDWLTFHAASSILPDIYVVDIPLQFKLNVSRLRLPDENCHAKNPAWSNDGRLAFVWLCYLRGSVEILDFNTGRFSQIVESSDDYWWPGWSAANQLAFIVQHMLNSDLHVIDSQSGTVNVIYEGGSIGGFAWSPDGRLAFTAAQSPSYIYELFIREADGTLSKETQPLQGMTLIGWSSDEAYLAYSYAGTRGFIHIFDVAARQVIHTLPLAESTYPIMWSPDDQIVLVDDTSMRRILLLNPTTGKTQPLIDRAGLIFDYPSWSPDGRLALIADQNGLSSVYVLDNGVMTNVTGKLDVEYAPIVWAR
jgi:Tol biopolymer transport system component